MRRRSPPPGWRKPVGEAYPSPSLLAKFFARAVPVTTASDSHGPALVGTSAATLAGLARGAGYGSLRGFVARRGRDVPIGGGGDARRPGVAVTLPEELARELTGLDTASRQHLARLVASWGLLADLSFSDLLLFVPLDEYSLAVSGQTGMRGRRAGARRSGRASLRRARPDAADDQPDAFPVRPG